MELNLKGRAALVTGGSRGIGFGVAQLLAAEGCNVHLASRSAADLETAKKKITAAHRVEITVHALDLSKRENALALVKACGPLDILINNAGAIPQGTITALQGRRCAHGCLVPGRDCVRVAHQPLAVSGRQPSRHRVFGRLWDGLCVHGHYRWNLPAPAKGQLDGIDGFRHRDRYIHEFPLRAAQGP